MLTRVDWRALQSKQEHASKPIQFRLALKRSMSKPPTSQRGKRPQVPKAKPPPPPRTSMWKRWGGAAILAGKLLGGLSIVAGLISFLLSFHVNLVFQNTIPMDSNNSFADEFVFTNTGWLSAYNVKYTCWAPFVFTPQPGVMPMAFEQGVPHLAAEEILPGQPVSVRCPEYIGIPIDRVFFGITFHYRPSFWPFRTLQRFKFDGKPDSDGKIRWIPGPADAHFPPVNP